MPPAAAQTPFVPALSAAEAELAHRAAQCVVETHRRLTGFLQVGQKLAQIDAFVAQQLEDLSCRSCFLGYKVGRSPAFPSHACLSVNDCIVHGTAGYYVHPLKPGDVLKIDIGVWHQGFIGDAAWTYTLREFPTPEVERLVRVGRESLRRGIEQMKPGARLVEFARAVQNCVEVENGFHCTRGLGGHGIGRKLHAPPFVSNVVPAAMSSHFGMNGSNGAGGAGAGLTEWPEATTIWKPGTLVAVEPMLAIGSGLTVQHKNQWPVFTADGSIAAHFEHDVLITETGNRVLSEGLDELPLVVG